MMPTDDSIKQRAEWRTRLMRDVIDGAHGKSTLVEMLAAGLHQAYAEGVNDCAEMCETIATRAADHRARRVADVLATSMRDYNRQNNLTVATTILPECSRERCECKETGPRPDLCRMRMSRTDDEPVSK
jgi:hypothetical protein